ncbi:MAG: methylcobamide:CoM methyltransferase [Candidatus Methanolliviera sp. GoM_asphalt]|nr:MAG: methylcobamide:CoM methyltransferase [Candidatus Methanolliviera sp. GoM_asphalt]
MVEEMTSMERVMAVLNREEPDRVPVVFIATTIGAREAGVNVPEYATDGKKMAEGQLNFLKRYGVDLVTPGSGIASLAEAFGTTTKYYDTQYDSPAVGEPAVKKPEDWEKLEFKTITPGMIASLEAGQIIHDEVGDTVPIMGGIISPLTVATWVAGMSDALRATKKNPEALHKGLKIIADQESQMVEAQISMGAKIFMVVCTRATRDIFTDEQYAEFGIPYDLKVLEHLKGKDAHVMVHVCGNVPMLKTIIEKYPISAVNWWDRGTQYNLEEIKEKYGDKIIIVGGLDQTRTLIIGTPQEVEEQAKDAIRQAAAGGGFMLSAGCELGAITPPENILAAVNAAKKYGKYPLSL